MNNISNFKKYLPIFVAFVMGAFISAAVPYALAHGGNTNLIHACVKNSTGSIHIVAVNDTCASNETATDWSKNGIGTFGGFTTKELIGYASINESIYYKLFDGVNFTNSSFSSPRIAFSSFMDSNFTNASLSDPVLTSVDFRSSDFTGVTINVGGATNVNFANTLFVNASLNDINFNNSDFTGANFTGSTRNNVTWSNSTCPDGTNSDVNGNTCEGHLVP